MKKKNECGDENYQGSYMVSRNLHAIMHALEEIMPLVDEHDEIESWIEHKVSVAKEAISSVRDALMYDDDEEGGDDNGVKITVLDGDDDDVHADHLGLKKMMGGCGSNENKIFLGSGAINEKKQLITNNSNLKVLVESVKREGEIIKIKTKSGKTYEYLPHFGAELEMLRCEGYNIKIKK
jgi:hypothetical protein